MKIKKIEDCDCLHPDVKSAHPGGCTLNQILKCHGDQSIGELLKHVELEKGDK